MFASRHQIKIKQYTSALIHSLSRSPGIARGESVHAHTKHWQFKAAAVTFKFDLFGASSRTLACMMFVRFCVSMELEWYVCFVIKYTRISYGQKVRRIRKISWIISGWKLICGCACVTSSSSNSFNLSRCAETWSESKKKDNEHKRLRNRTLFVWNSEHKRFQFVSLIAIYLEPMRSYVKYFLAIFRSFMHFTRTDSVTKSDA